MDQPVINITGPVTVHVSAPQKKKDDTPSIPLTPFVKAAVMEVRNELLAFNIHVERAVTRNSFQLHTAALSALSDRVAYLEKVVGNDYNPDLLTEYTADIAAIAYQFANAYGDISFNG